MARPIPRSIELDFKLKGRDYFEESVQQPRQGYQGCAVEVLQLLVGSYRWEENRQKGRMYVHMGSELIDSILVDCSDLTGFKISSGFLIVIVIRPLL